MKHGNVFSLAFTQYLAEIQEQFNAEVHLSSERAESSGENTGTLSEIQQRRGW